MLDLRAIPARESGVPESNRACCVGSAVVRLEQTPRWWADARPGCTEVQRERRRPGAPGGNRTRATPIPTACSTFELQRRHLVESPGTAPGEPACKAGARPSARPRSGQTRDRTEPARFWRPRTSQRPVLRAAYEDRTRLTRSTIELRHQSHHAAYGAPRTNRTCPAAFRKRCSASSGRSLGVTHG